MSRRKGAPDPGRIEMKGKRYGRLIGIKPSHRVGKTLFWKFKCDCGSTVVRAGTEVRVGNTLSCGCLRREATRARRLQHGHSLNNRERSPEYRSWVHMKDRCLNSNDKAYRRYGARGITVHPRFLRSFSAFLKEVGLRPSPTHSIDRKNNRKGYMPGNLRWATPKQQARNTRRNLWATISGKRKTVAEWIEKLGKSGAAVYQRIHRGASPREAVMKGPFA